MLKNGYLFFGSIIELMVVCNKKPNYRLNNWAFYLF